MWLNFRCGGWDLRCMEKSQVKGMIIVEEPYENYFIVPSRAFAQLAKAIVNRYAA